MVAAPFWHALHAEAGGTETLANPVALGSAATIDVEGNATTSSLALNGGISGSTTLTKSGPAILQITTANGSFTGGVTISAGTLALGASGSIANSPTIAVGSGATYEVSAVSGYTLGSSQTLSGTGTVKGAFTSNGTISPGASIGTLSVTGDVTMSGSTSHYTEQINSDGSPTADLLAITGNLSFSGSPVLDLSDLGSTPLADGTKLTMITYTGTWNNGTFNGLADDSTFSPGGANSFVINYNDTTGGVNSVTISAVPEASAVMLGGLICGVVGLAYGGRSMLRRKSPGVAKAVA